MNEPIDFTSNTASSAEVFDEAVVSVSPPVIAAGGNNPWEAPSPDANFGPVTLDNGRICIGRVGAPPGQEANSQQFCFWIPEDALVEATQIVTVESRIGGIVITY